MASKLFSILTVAMYHEAMTKGPRCDLQVVFFGTGLGKLAFNIDVWNALRCTAGNWSERPLHVHPL